MVSRIPSALLVGAAILCSAHVAAEIQERELAISERQFIPSTLAIPADERVRLMIRNDDSLPVEFESADLSREVIVPPNGRVPVYIGPLSPGTYEFFDDFNPDARGSIKVGTAGQGE